MKQQQLENQSYDIDVKREDVKREIVLRFHVSGLHVSALMNPFDNANPYTAQQQSQYKDFTATELFCPTCRQATPVRERLLLVLPDGDLYEYRCTYCGTSLGEKRVKEQTPIQLVY